MMLALEYGKSINEHTSRGKKSQCFEPGPICRHHGPRYTTATLPLEISESNDYIYEHRYLDIYT